MRAQRTRECECGCGESIPARDTQGRGRRFVQGHQHHLSPVAYLEEDRGYKTPCWVWQRCKTHNGYAVNTQAAKIYGTRYVHIHNYVDKHGPVPEGLDLDHLCRVRACINPDHLEPVTHAVNIRRGNGTKLTARHAREIRALAKDGWPTREIADAYDLSTTSVQGIMNGTRWANAA